MTTAELITKHGAMAAYHADAEQLAELQQIVAANSATVKELWYAEVMDYVAGVTRPPTNKRSFRGQNITKPYVVFRGTRAECENWIRRCDSFRAVWEVR